MYDSDIQSHIFTVLLLSQLEDSQRLKAGRKEAHMFASPAEHAAQRSLAKGMASRYEEQM